VLKRCYSANAGQKKPWKENPLDNQVRVESASLIHLSDSCHESRKVNRCSETVISAFVALIQCPYRSVMQEGSDGSSSCTTFTIMYRASRCSSGVSAPSAIAAKRSKTWIRKPRNVRRIYNGKRPSAHVKFIRSRISCMIA